MHNLFLYMAIMSIFGVRKEKNDDATGMRRDGGRGGSRGGATQETGASVE